MRTTINLDEELVVEAQQLTGIEGKTALVKEGLRALIGRESALRAGETRREPAAACIHPATQG